MSLPSDEWGLIQRYCPLTPELSCLMSGNNYYKIIS